MNMWTKSHDPVLSFCFCFCSFHFLPSVCILQMILRCLLSANPLFLWLVLDDQKLRSSKNPKIKKKLSKIWFLDGKSCLLLHRLQITTKLLFNGTKFALTATYHPVETIRGYIRGGWRLAPTNSYCAHCMYTKWTWILHKTYSTFSRYNNHSTHFFVFFKERNHSYCKRVQQRFKA